MPDRRKNTNQAKQKKRLTLHIKRTRKTNLPHPQSQVPGQALLLLPTLEEDFALALRLVALQQEPAGQEEH